MKKTDIKIPALIIIAVIPLLLFIIFFHNGFSHDIDDWGSFGSFMGGAVAPFLSILSIVLVFRTIQLTQKNHSEQLLQIRKEHNYNKFNDLCIFLEKAILNSWLTKDEKKKKDILQSLTRTTFGDIIYSRNENVTLEEQRQYAEANAERLLPYMSDDIKEVILCLEYLCHFILDDENKDSDFMKNILQIRIDNSNRFIISLYVHTANEELDRLLNERWMNFRPSIDELS